MIDIKPPPSQKLKGKGLPPPEEQATINLGKKEGMVPLNFKIPAEFKREFKSFASNHDMSMSHLLQISFTHYKETKI